MDDVLQLIDEEAGPWLDAQREEEWPPLHVVLGDSVARDSGLHSSRVQDSVVNLARGGATWTSLAKDLPELASEWKQRAGEERRRLGSAVVWLTGNEVYNHHTGLYSISEAVLEPMAEYACEVTEALLGLAEAVIVLGPIARPSYELLPVKWEETAAFLADRRLIHSLPKEVIFVSLGRQLTKKLYKKHHVVSDCWSWYQRDGVHLARYGYVKVARAPGLPEWLCFPDLV